MATNTHGSISETALTELLTQIAVANISTVESLEDGGNTPDFFETSVWCLKDALTQAFIAGQQAAKTGKTEIAWEGGEVEIIELADGRNIRTGITFPNEWEAKEFIKTQEDKLLVFKQVK